jgi:glutaminase
MKTPLPDYLANVIEACDIDNSGHLADYIPELANANPNRLALAMSTVDGEIYSVGDDDVEFTIQSISKPFVMPMFYNNLALMQYLRK